MNFQMGNHDKRRVGSRYGENRIDLMSMLQMFLPGVSITYMVSGRIYKTRWRNRGMDYKFNFQRAKRLAWWTTMFPGRIV